MSIRVKLIIALTTILVAAFISLSLFNYNVSRQNARDESLNSALPLTRDNIYSEIQAGLMRPLHVSSLMANDTFLKDWATYGEKNVLQITRYLEEIQEKYGFFSTFYVSALTGDYYYSQGILKTVSKNDSHDVWFYDFISSGEESDLVVDTNQAADDLLTIFINHRVEDRNGKLLGVAGVGLKMDDVSRLLKKFSEKYSKIIFLVDPEGTIQAHHEIKLIPQTNIKFIPGLSEIADQLLATDHNEPATYESQLGDDRIFLTARYLPEFKWFLIVEQLESAILKSARNNFVRTLAIGGFVTLIIVILSIWVVNHFQLRLERQANTDELTGIANRRSFERKVDDAISLYAKTGTPFSIVLLDVDGFKQVNDVCGHLEGDVVLREISDLVLSAVRETDFCARWGGDEFIVLISGDCDQGGYVAERIRQCVEQVWNCGQEHSDSSDGIKVTVSCGVAQFDEGDTLDSLTLRADQAMYESKELGRNRVVKG